MSKKINFQVGLKQSKDIQVLLEASNFPVTIKIAKFAGILNYTVSGNLHIESNDNEAVISSTLLLKGDSFISDLFTGFKLEESLTKDILLPFSEKGKKSITRLKCGIDDEQNFFTLEKVA